MKSYKTTTITEKCTYCDICNKETPNQIIDDYMQSCYVCYKDLCKDHKVIIGILTYCPSCAIPVP